MNSRRLCVPTLLKIAAGLTAPDRGMARIGGRDLATLSRRELALFRELVQWRDAAALKLDRATFRVVSNDVLFEAARTAVSGRLSGPAHAGTRL